MVKPLKSGISGEGEPPKKSVFSRVRGVFDFCETEIGDLLPNVALYQAEPHLDGDFYSFFVSGQTCGQTTYIGNFIQLTTAKIVRCFQEFTPILARRLKTLLFARSAVCQRGLPADDSLPNWRTTPRKLLKL